jgi:hypothetical protein
MRSLILGGGLVAVTLFSGCGLENAIHTAEVYDDLNAADVLSGPAADLAAIEMRSGEATYVGLGTVTASNGTTATAFLGDASIRVDFDARTVSGEIAMYSGKGGLDASTDPEAFFDQIEADPTDFLLSMGAASGTVTLSDGSFVDEGFAASATSGDLIYDSTTVVVTGGTVTGEFTGAEANGVRSTETDVTGTLNGTEAADIAVYFAGAE